MIKKIFLIFALILSFAFIYAEWIEINGDSEQELFGHVSNGIASTAIHFSLDGYDIESVLENGEKYQKITYQNEGSFLDFGYPDLPRFTRMYAIPNDGGVRYEISSQQEIMVSDITVYPIQHLQLESQPQKPDFYINEEFYSGNQVFPLQQVEVSEPQIFRDFRLVSVTINPFQYDPATKELKIITDLDLTLTADSSIRAANPKQNDGKISRSFENLYRATIENYDDYISNADPIFQAPCYLFIYPNNTSVLSILDYLTEWKELKGYEVHVVSTATSGTSSTSIKNYIQNAYNTWENPPEFITLIGDASGTYSIPTFFESYSGYGGEGDHPYTQLEGNDILADAIIGRLSFNSTSEFQVIVHKILNYEKEPYMGTTSWYNRSVMCGDESTSGPSCVFTKQAIVEMMDYYVPNIVPTEIYDSPYASQMSTGINTGCTYFNYRGYYGMSSFNNSSITNLNNGLMLPFAVFLTCGTGSFASGTSRSETFIRTGSTSTQRGAIAAIGTATTGTHTTFNNCVDVGTYWGVFADQIYNPGGALIRGKLHLYNSFPNNPSNKVTIFSYWNNLIGDPGVDLWTGIPQELTVTYPSQVSSGSNYLEVTVQNDVGFGVEGAWVCALAVNGSISELGYTNSDGIVYLPIEATTLGNVNLTVTKHNYIPHLGSFTVANSAVFVNVDSYQIDDDMSGTSSGNNDELINPGESIELAVDLKNFGTGTVSNVTASITSETDFITITDADEEFGNISAGGTATSLDDFDFSVDDNVLGGSEIQLDMTIEDGSGNSWDDHIFLPIAGVNLFVSDYSIEDANGILEPGETAELVVTLFNTGSATASNIQGELSCDNTNITFTDSLGSFESILPGEEGDNNLDRFEISADIHSINGAQIEFDLHLFNSDGYEQDVCFLVEVGTVTINDPLGPDSYGYIAYDSGDDSYDLAPDYNWIEINPSYGGSGTNLNLNDNGDDGDVETIFMPFSFSFYGITYNTIAVCSNGWLAPGGSSQASFMNSQIPGPHGPSPMIAPFWDDLRIGSGDVFYYYDENIHAFIVEWSHLQSDWDSSEETFQVLICDPAYYPTPTGDAEIVFQYDTIHNTNYGSYSGSYVQHGEYSTVGLEDHTSHVGLQYTFCNTYPTAAATLADGLAIKFTTDGSGVVQAAPIMNLSQTSFDFILQPNSTSSQVLQISNLGEANLAYNFSKNYDISESTSESQTIPTNTRGQGGPDNYGYHWYDSNELGGPVYNWRDISGLGTAVTFTNNDQGTDLMPIGFTFNFYGTDYTEFRINPNGWIGFGDDNTEWSNLSLPDTDAPRPAVMPFWDDLDPIEGGDVYYYSTSDSLVVWFDDVIHYVGNYNGTYDFEVVIYTDGTMLFQYSEVSGDIDSATIGIQNEDADDALQVVYNSPYVEDELAIKIVKVVDWLQLDSMYGFVESGQTETITLAVSSEDLTMGSYFCNLVLTTNDPEASVVEIPVNLVVSNQFPNLALSQDSFDFGTVLLGNSLTDTLVIYNQGNQTLNVTDITVSLPAYEVSATSFNITANSSAEIYITFTPTENNIYEAIMSISSNDPLNPITTVDLIGDAIYPDIEISQSSFDFGVVNLQTEVVDTLVVSNLGTDVLHVSEISVAGDAFSLDIESFDLQPSETIDVLISFIPTEEITYTDTISIYCDDPFEPFLEIDLTGIGQNLTGSEDMLPSVTKVNQNYPNPFNPTTTINYSVSQAGRVSIIVYNIKGEKVRTLVDSEHEPQWYKVTWNGKDDNGRAVSSGVYFYRFLAEGENQTRKMLLLK
jgi:hypothetical protein